MFVACDAYVALNADVSDADVSDALVSDAIK